MTTDEPAHRYPAWLRQTKRLFPQPLFAGCISSACLLVGILFAIAAVTVRGAGWVAIPSVLFLMGCFATASAAIIRTESDSSVTAKDAQVDKPTYAIFILLIGVYSWLFTLGTHLFQAFLKNGPGSFKYYVTLAIAISASVFMQVHGRHVVRKHFGSVGGRKLELSTRQAIYVAIFVVSIGIYTTWLLV